MGPVNDSVPSPKGKAISRSAAVVLAAVKSHFFPWMNTNCTDESKTLPFNRSIHEAETLMADPCSITLSFPLNSQCFALFPWKRFATVTLSLGLLCLSISIRRCKTLAVFNVMHLHQDGINWWIHSQTSINSSRTLTQRAQPPLSNNFNGSTAKECYVHLQLDKQCRSENGKKRHQEILMTISTLRKA